MKSINFILIFFCSILLSCTDLRYQRAKALISEQQYEDASYFAQSLLEDSPENPEYQNLLKIAQENAGQFYLEKAKSYLASDVQTAQYFYDKARKFIPQDPGLKEIEIALKKAKADIVATVDIVGDLIKRNRWDDALLQIEKLQNYKSSSSEIENLFKNTLQGSFDWHFLQGITYFQEKRYENASQEFDICLKRTPDDSSAKNWKEICQNHYDAVNRYEKGNSLFTQGEYETAFSLFNEAKEKLSHIDPSQQEPMLLQKIEGQILSTRQKWAQQIYEKAVEEESMQTKSGYINALRLYRTCLTKISPFLDCELRIQKSKRNLALLFQKEGKRWMEYPQLRYMAFAHRLFQEASSYDSSLPELARQLEISEALCFLKLKNTIKVRVLGDQDFIPILQKNLEQFINGEHFPFIVASTGDAQEVLDEYTAKLAEYKYCQPEEKPDIPFPVYQLHLEVLQSLAEKTGEKSGLARFSTYYSHREIIPSLAFLEHEVNLQYYDEEGKTLSLLLDNLEGEVRARHDSMVSAMAARDREMGVLTELREKAGYLRNRKEMIFAQKNDILAKIQENQKQIAKAEADIRDYQKKLQDVLTPELKRYYEQMIAQLRNQIQAWNHYNNEEAPNILAHLEEDLKQAVFLLLTARQEEENQENCYNESEIRYQRFTDEYNHAVNLLNSIKERLDNSQRKAQKLSHVPPQGQEVNLRSAYQYSYHPYQLFGKIWIKGYLIDITRQNRLLPLDIKLEEKKEDESLHEINDQDAEKLKNHEETLPSAESLERGIWAQVNLSLEEKLAEFLREHYARYWDWAMDASVRKHIPQMAENLALFIECNEHTQSSKHPKYQEALLRLQEIMNSSIE